MAASTPFSSAVPTRATVQAVAQEAVENVRKKNSHFSTTSHPPLSIIVATPLPNIGDNQFRSVDDGGSITFDFSSGFPESFPAEYSQWFFELFGVRQCFPLSSLNGSTIGVRGGSGFGFGSGSGSGSGSGGGGDYNQLFFSSDGLTLTISNVRLPSGGSTFYLVISPPSVAPTVNIVNLFINCEST